VRPRIHRSLGRSPTFRATALVSWDQQRIWHSQGVPARQSTPKAMAKAVQNQIFANSPISFFTCLPPRDRFRAQVNFHGSTSFACDSRYLDMTHGVRPSNSDLHVCPRTGAMQSWHQHFRFSKTPNPRHGGRQARSIQVRTQEQLVHLELFARLDRDCRCHPRNSKQKAAPNFVSKCGLNVGERTLIEESGRIPLCKCGICEREYGTSFA